MYSKLNLQLPLKSAIHGEQNTSSMGKQILLSNDAGFSEPPHVTQPKNVGHPAELCN